MGRHKKMAAAAAPPPVPLASTYAAPALSLVPHPVVPACEELTEAGLQIALVDDVPPGQASTQNASSNPQSIAAELRTMNVRGVADKIFKQAVIVVAPLPAGEAEALRPIVSSVSRYLQWCYDTDGGFGLDALTRLKVDRYVGIALSGSDRSRATTRSRLYKVGRFYHPDQYPKLWVRGEKKKERPPQRPATEAEVETTYLLANSMASGTRDSIRFIVDAATGAGARSEEINLLTPADVNGLTVDGREIATLRLLNEDKLTYRVVPIMDIEKSRRTLRYARQRRGQQFMLPGSGRNRVNGVLSKPGRRGVQIPVNAVNLRHYWLIRAARAMPAEVLQRLANLGASKALDGLMPYVRTADTFEIIYQLMEAGL